MQSLGSARSIVAAVVTNFSMGLLYCWALFAKPIAAELDVSLTTVGSIPSLSLLTFTIGINLHPWLARRFNIKTLTILAFVAAAIGVGAFAVAPSVPTILVGFGVVFGLSSGIGYGLALQFARSVSPPVSAMALGMCVTSFALTAIVLAFIVHGTVERFGIQTTFGFLAISLLCLGGIVFWLASTVPASSTPPDVRVSSILPPVSRIMTISLAFFTCCFVGLGVLANSSTLLEAFKVSATDASAGAAIFNAAYIVGSLFGAPIAEAIGGKKAILGILGLLVVAFCGAILYAFPASGWAVTAVSACALGSTASVFPVYLGQVFGKPSVAYLFPRILLFYGFAGFLAPWMFAYLFDHTGEILFFLCISLFLAAVSLVLLSLRRPGLTGQAVSSQELHH